jgi:hypothetical protein
MQSSPPRGSGSESAPCSGAGGREASRELAGGGGGGGSDGGSDEVVGVRLSESDLTTLLRSLMAAALAHLARFGCARSLHPCKRTHAKSRGLGGAA